MKFVSHAYAIWNSIKTWTGAYETYQHYISFDAEFYDDFEFLLKIKFPPTHFEIFAIFKFCVGGSKKFLFHRIKQTILSHIICIFCMFYLPRIILKNWVRNFQRGPATLNFRIDHFGTHIRIQETKLHQNHTLVEKIIFCSKWFTPYPDHRLFTGS